MTQMTRFTIASVTSPVTRVTRSMTQMTRFTIASVTSPVTRVTRSMTRVTRLGDALHDADDAVHDRFGYEPGDAGDAAG